MREQIQLKGRGQRANQPGNDERENERRPALGQTDAQMCGVTYLAGGIGSSLDVYVGTDLDQEHDGEHGQSNGHGSREKEPRHAPAMHRNTVHHLGLIGRRRILAVSNARALGNYPV